MRWATCGPPCVNSATSSIRVAPCGCRGDRQLTETHRPLTKETERLRGGGSSTDTLGKNRSQTPLKRGCENAHSKVQVSDMLTDFSHHTHAYRVVSSVASTCQQHAEAARKTTKSQGRVKETKKDKDGRVVGKEDGARGGGGADRRQAGRQRKTGGT